MLHVDIVLSVYLVVANQDIEAEFREGIYQDPPHPSPMITLDHQGESFVPTLSSLIH